jgi:diguanylate cyclase (GGDEF)-like protein/PAS domain S-box-containing protein
LEIKLKFLKSLNIKKDKKVEENLIDLEKQSKILFNCAPDAYYINDMKGNFIDGNRAAEKLMGYSKSVLIGKNFLKLKILPSNQISKAAKLLTLNALNKSTGPDEFILNKRDGSQFIAEIRTYPTIIDGKHVVLGIARDITKHKDLERNLEKAKGQLELKVRERTKELLDSYTLLKNSEKKYKDLFEGAPDSIATINRKGIITSCNTILEQIVGNSKGEIIGKHFSKLSFLMVKDIPRYIKIFTALLTGKRIKPFEISVQQKDGKILYGEVRVSKIIEEGKTVGFQIVTRDITDSKEANARLAESQEKYRELYDDAPDGIITTNKAGIITSCNKIVYNFTGYSKKDLIGKHFARTNAVNPNDIPKYLKIYSSLLMGKHIKPFEITLKNKNKNIISLEVHFGTVRKEGKIDGFQLILRDISEKKESEKSIIDSERKFRELSEMLPETVFEVCLKGNISYVNKIGYKLFGYSKKDLDNGLNIFEIVEKNDLKKLKDDMEYLFSGKTNGYKQYKALKKDGTLLDIEIHSNLIINNKGKPSGIRGIIVDVTQRKKAEEKIKHMSFHDYLTGIYNRAFFEEELKRLDSGRQLPLSVIIGDVNGLKIVNDAFGHKRGDELLGKIASVLTKTFRKEDIVARWGGDEYSIILPETNLKKALKILDRVKVNLEKESARTLPLSISFGVATKTNKVQNITDIIKEAEDKMYRHKLIEGQSTHSAIISSLEKALEERDYETKEHVRRMKEMATGLGREMELPDEKIDELTLLAALHDIGKISIADSIILKPRSLNEEEWNAVKKHPQVGYRIAESSSDLAPIAKGILYHHERWDGKGYPKGLKGEDIPLISRIIAIVDSYDAMTNDRPYRNAFSKEEAMEEIRKCSGTQFDPKLAKMFIDIVSKEQVYAMSNKK